MIKLHCHYHHNTCSPWWLHVTWSITKMHLEFTTSALPGMSPWQIAHCPLVETACGGEWIFLYWLSLMLLKVQSLTLSEWQIGMQFRLEGSQHTQRIKHYFAHLPNSPCVVLMPGMAGRHLSLDDLLERWQCLTHCSYLAPHLHCSAVLEERVFRVEWLSFLLCPGKRCSQCNGTLHLGHQHPNGILKNGSVCVLGVRLSADSLLLGNY